MSSFVLKYSKMKLFINITSPNDNKSNSGKNDERAQ